MFFKMSPDTSWTSLRGIVIYTGGRTYLKQIWVAAYLPLLNTSRNFEQSTIYYYTLRLWLTLSAKEHRRGLLVNYGAFLEYCEASFNSVEKELRLESLANRYCSLLVAIDTQEMNKATGSTACSHMPSNQYTKHCPMGIWTSSLGTHRILKRVTEEKDGLSELERLPRMAVGNWKSRSTYLCGGHCEDTDAFLTRLLEPQDQSCPQQLPYQGCKCLGRFVRPINGSIHQSDEYELEWDLSLHANERIHDMAEQPEFLRT